MSSVPTSGDAPEAGGRAFLEEDGGPPAGGRWRSPPAARPAASEELGPAPTRAPAEDVTIGFFGALTGAAANLGINIRNGVKLAIDQHNERERGLPGDPGGVRLRGRPEPGHRPGDPGHRRRHRSRRRRPAPSPASPTPPARSSPRAACPRSPRRRRTRPWRRTAGTPSTASSVTTPARPGGVQLHQRRAAEAQRVRGRRRVRVRRGPGRDRRSDLGDVVVGTDTVQTTGRPTSRPITAIQRLGRRGRSSSAVTTLRRAWC